MDALLGNVAVQVPTCTGESLVLGANWGMLAELAWFAVGVAAGAAIDASICRADCSVVVAATELPVALDAGC